MMHFRQWKRRDFITLLGGAALAWPHALRAQVARRPKVGIVYPGPAAMSGPRVESFLNGLRGAGYGGPEQIELVRSPAVIRHAPCRWPRRWSSATSTSSSRSAR